MVLEQPPQEDIKEEVKKDLPEPIIEEPVPTEDKP